MNVCMYVYVYVCMYVCTYVRTYVCMYLFIKRVQILKQEIMTSIDPIN